MDGDFRILARKIDRLRRSLPVAGYPRGALLAKLREKGVICRCAPRLRVVDVFDAGAHAGVICRFVVEGQDERSFVAPLTQIALGRRQPLARAISTQRLEPRYGVA